INHPPVSRNKDLSHLLATLRIAERQGVGVDRMFADMIRHGHPSPVIEEVDGVSVRTVLAGERPDSGWIQWISEIEPDPRRDLRVLMALHHLSVQLWTDPVDLAPVLQLTIEEARQAVQQLLDHRLRGRPLIHEIEGVPSAAPMPSVAVDSAALEALATLRRRAGVVDRRPSREQVALSYARSRGRISTTELGSIVGAAPTNLGRVLRNLEHDGAIEPSRPNRRGPGFYYRYVAGGDGPVEEVVGGTLKERPAALHPHRSRISWRSTGTCPLTRARIPSPSTTRPARASSTASPRCRARRRGPSTS